MKTSLLSCAVLAAFALSTSTALLAEGLPKEQPKYLTIIREKVKAGRGSEHSKHEAGWPAAYEKAKSPDYYLALTSMTGPSEAWYLIPWSSYKAEADSMKRDEKNAVLSAELERLASRDAEFIESTCVVQAVARPELSIGKFPDVSKARFFQISMFQLRPGKDEDFGKIAKAYSAARLRAAPNSSVRMYSVVSGMPTPCYIAISSMESYGDLDQMMEDSMATFAKASDEEKAEFKNFGDLVTSEETRRFRLDPVQSYVSKETRESDADFWIAK